MKKDIKKYWVLEYGSDCDGFYTRGNISAFSNLEDAEQCIERCVEWSDGMQYQLIDSMDELKEYCYEHQLNIAHYL